MKLIENAEMNQIDNLRIETVAGTPWRKDESCLRSKRRVKGNPQKSTSELVKMTEIHAEMTEIHVEMTSAHVFRSFR
jgi:hypothetical protein